MSGFFVAIVSLTLAAGAAPSIQAVAPVDPQTTPAAGVEPGHLYDRIAVIGASVSDGFGVVVREQAAPTDAATKKPAGKHVNLADVLVAASSAEPAPVVHHYASGFFFANPGTVGKSEIDRALAIKPTLVLALDYLFWFAYGTVTDTGEPMGDGERLANLEAGLAQLDRLLGAQIPIVIADIPDMHDAIGKMLSASQVPSAEVLDKVNARISEWTATRPTVKLMSLTTVLAALKSGGLLKLAGRSWNPADFGALLQKDQLHPTFAGTVIIAAGLIDLARTNDPTMAPPFVFDVEAIRKRTLAALAATKAAAKPAAATADSPRGR